MTSCYTVSQYILFNRSSGGISKMIFYCTADLEKAQMLLLLLFVYVTGWKVNHAYFEILPFTLQKDSKRAFLCKNEMHSKAHM